MTNEEAIELINSDVVNYERLTKARKIATKALEKQIEAESKSKRRIDLMTEEELAKIIAAVDGSVFGNMCVGCVLDDKDCECSDGNECGKAIAHYLLSPAEEE